MKTLTRLRIAVAMTFAVFGWMGCEKQDPNISTPTSGKLVVFVDEIYAPLVKQLADSFMVRCPDAKVTVQSMNAREAVQKLLDAQERRPKMGYDTATTTAIVIGRSLLKDESDLISKAQLEMSEYAIAYDGLAIAVPQASALDETMLNFLQNVLRSTAPVESMLNKLAPPNPLRFVFTDQNSSVYSSIRKLLLNDSNVAAPSVYYSTSDSVLKAVAAGNGITLIGWYAAHRDSMGIRTMRVGFNDTNKAYRPPVRVHPTSLVTNAYPLKLLINGYTFSVTNSLASGFLTWLATSQDGQYFLANQGLQPVNVKFKLISSEE